MTLRPSFVSRHALCAALALAPMATSSALAAAAAAAVAGSGGASASVAPHAPASAARRTAPAAAGFVGQGPCLPPDVDVVPAPRTDDLKAEKARIDAADRSIQQRNAALQQREAALSAQPDPAAVAAYNADLAQLRADAAANDQAWDRYRAQVARGNAAARARPACGRLAVAKPAANAGAAIPPTVSTGSPQDAEILALQPDAPVPADAGDTAATATPAARPVPVFSDRQRGGLRGVSSGAGTAAAPAGTASSPPKAR